MQKMKTTYIVMGLLAVLTATSCKKKLDFQYDNRVNTEPMPLSSTRIINLASATQLSINGKKLTSYMLPDIDGYYGPDQTRPTIYFPETGRMGITFTIPQEFVNATGGIDSIRFSSLGNKIGLPDSRKFSAKDNFNDPHDYYYIRLRPNIGTYQDSLVAVSRSVSPPSNPTNIKIRLLNLSSEPNGLSQPGVFRKGPMSLAWANGTTISGMENIAPGSASAYIEMPYGTYQLKVLEASGKEVQGNSSFVLNVATGTAMDYYGDIGVGGRKDTWLTYAPVKTFQPGGIYTIVVSMNYDCSIPTGNPNGETVNTEGNTFRIISDISEPVNVIYSRVQAVNVTQGTDVQWLVNDKPLGNALSFTQQTDYKTFVTGVYTLKATDKSGATLAQQELRLQPGDNITAWLYPAKDGKATIALSSNNMSGKFFNGNAGEEGSYSMYKDNTPTWTRFMNFCSELDEVTFTTDDGQPFLATPGSVAVNASQHIQLGKPVTQDPNVQLMLNMPGKVLVYASRPGITPGDWLPQITPLKSTDFIANPSLYKTPQLPNREPGYYTVALVGKKAGEARMIIIKHNK